MQGYYDMFPGAVLERPLVLTGFLGTQTAQTAQAICALTGLPLVDLDRDIESRSGRSLSHLILREGECAFRNVEHALLLQALDRTPPAVIALGDGALLAPDNRKHVLRKADLICLTAPLSELAGRIRDQLAKRPGSVPVFMQKGSVVTALGLQPLYDERAPGYAAAAQTLDISGQTPTQVARAIIKQRELLG